MCGKLQQARQLDRKQSSQRLGTAISFAFPTVVISWRCSAMPLKAQTGQEGALSWVSCRSSTKCSANCILSVKRNVPLAVKERNAKRFSYGYETGMQKRGRARPLTTGLLHTSPLSPPPSLLIHACAIPPRSLAPPRKAEASGTGLLATGAEKARSCHQIWPGYKTHRCTRNRTQCLRYKTEKKAAPQPHEGMEYSLATVQEDEGSQRPFFL